jgi:acetyl-CoA carboxylase carboxyltransferase component
MPEGTAAPGGAPRAARTTTGKAGEVASAVREQFIGSIKQSQQITLDAVNTWADTFGKIVPKLPASPFVPPLPELKETIDATFDVAQELLNVQREFATGLVSALAPTADR